jgi:hypothetical protein
MVNERNGCGFPAVKNSRRDVGFAATLTWGCCYLHSNQNTKHFSVIEEKEFINLIGNPYYRGPTCHHFLEE